jgi:signal transduction histidine kinase
VLVESSLGWVLVRRTLDLDRPARQLGLAVPAVGLLVLVVALGLAGMATRPLTAAREGMERIAAGDLDHRLETEGPDEIARVARAFNAMADRIAALLRTERELMAGMSHELRTPLARLRLEMEMLRDRGLPETRIAAIEGDLAEIDGLVGMLLQLSRIQLGERVLQASEVDWKDLVGKVLPSSGLSDVEVRGPGGTFRGDADLLARVAGNLLQNCARHAPGRVTVSCQGGALVVEDEGPGIPEGGRMFEAFWRGGGSGGLGVGLALVRQIVDLHQGTVTAENRVGGGLRVVVKIPDQSG